MKFINDQYREWCHLDFVTAAHDSRHQAGWAKGLQSIVDWFAMWRAV